MWVLFYCGRLRMREKRWEKEAGSWKDNMGRVKYVNFTCIQWQRQKQRINMKIYRIAFYSIQYIL